jgi:hypothetical protein
VSYTQQTWHDEPTEDTPIDSARLGHIESGIGAAASTADSAAAAANTAQTAANTALVPFSPMDYMFMRIGAS